MITKFSRCLIDFFCTKPVQKEVVVQKTSTAVAQDALKNLAQCVKTHKKALIGIATVGAISTAAYYVYLRACQAPVNTSFNSNPFYLSATMISGISLIAFSYMFLNKKEEPKRIKIAALADMLSRDEEGRSIFPTKLVDLYTKIPIGELVVLLDAAGEQYSARITAGVLYAQWCEKDSNLSKLSKSQQAEFEKCIDRKQTPQRLLQEIDLASFMTLFNDLSPAEKNQVLDAAAAFPHEHAMILAEQKRPL
ncbi:MAG: hypothetical protein RLZZ453_1118 [Chlamydiota bacterium]|jgi:hypothetical protein